MNYNHTVFFDPKIKGADNNLWKVSGCVIKFQFSYFYHSRLHQELKNHYNISFSNSYVMFYIIWSVLPHFMQLPRSQCVQLKNTQFKILFQNLQRVSRKSRQVGFEKMYTRGCMSFIICASHILGFDQVGQNSEIRSYINVKRESMIFLGQVSMI